jgi:hypothetical protein
MRACLIRLTHLVKSLSVPCTTQDTQNARLYKLVKDGLDQLLVVGGIAICCGWNTMGFGLGRGYKMLEVLLVPHGGAHNDTIVTVEVKQ